MTPPRAAKASKPAEPTSGEPCSDCHHDRMYLPLGAVKNEPAYWLCSHGDHTATWHYRLESCPPQPPLEEARSQRIVSYQPDE